MFIDTTFVAGALLLLVVAYQQYCILRLDKDIDELTDKHNHFVDSVSSVFDEIIKLEADGELEDET
tara:strand:+ start:293 stop:490 length:198 start_codon:yes stop_codon:yes gene_type:complete